MSVFYSYRNLHVVPVFKIPSGIFPDQKTGAMFPKTTGSRNENPAGKSWPAAIQD
jgi:hypothetical protein